MKNYVDQVMHSALRKTGQEVNTIYYPFDGLFENIFGTIPVINHFVSFFKKYPFNIAIPNNYNELPNEALGRTENYATSFPDRVDVDCIICNDILTEQNNTNSSMISTGWHVPLIVNVHSDVDLINTHMIEDKINSTCIKDENVYSVFGHDVIKSRWGLENHPRAVTIPYGIPFLNNQNNFDERENIALICDVLNPETVDFINKVNQKIPNLNIYTTTPLSIEVNPNNTPTFCPTFRDLLKVMNNNKICIALNSEASHAPIIPMLAAANGCAIITNDCVWSSLIFNHNHDALLFKSLDQLQEQVFGLMFNSELINFLSDNAKQNMRSNYNMVDFQQKWITFISNVINKVYIR